MNFEELAPGVGKAGDLAEPGLTGTWVGCVELVEAGIAVGMQIATATVEQPPGMLGLAVG